MKMYNKLLCATACICFAAVSVPQAAMAKVEGSVLEADQQFLAAVQSGKTQVVGGMLYPKFEWIDSRGKKRNKDQTDAALKALASSTQNETNVKEYKYDGLNVVTGERANSRFMRVWTKKDGKWKAVSFIDTPISSGTIPFSTSAKVSGDCVNPCRTSPFTPKTKDEKEMMKILFKLKVDEWKGIPEDWSHYVLDGVDYVTNYGAISKEARVEHLKKKHDSKAPITPGDPVVSMDIETFGNAAVMSSEMVPYGGGQPYYSVRVWSHEPDHWWFANSQQTTILDTDPLPMPKE